MSRNIDIADEELKKPLLETSSRLWLQVAFRAHAFQLASLAMYSINYCQGDAVGPIWLHVWALSVEDYHL